MEPMAPASRTRGPWSVPWTLALVTTVAAFAAPVAAQQTDSVAAAQQTDSLSAGPAVVRPSSTTIRWYHAAAVVGGTSLLMLVDGPVKRFAQDHRSSTTDDAASLFRHFGQPEVYGTVSLGLAAVGLATGNHEVARVGGRAVASVGLAGASTLALKAVFGRQRPETGSPVLDFDPFGASEGLPSGHTSLAFALATSLAQDIHKPWVTVGLYTLAAGTGLSRINDNQHWLSDVGLGAVIGITSAKLASGRWQIFGIRTPSLLLTPTGGAALGWHATF